MIKELLKRKKTLELTLVIVLAHTLMRTQVYSPKEKRITAELKSIAYMQKYRLIEGEIQSSKW